MKFHIKFSVTSVYFILVINPLFPPWPFVALKFFKIMKSLTPIGYKVEPKSTKLKAAKPSPTKLSYYLDYIIIAYY